MALLGAVLLALVGTALATTQGDASLATLPREGDVHARLLQSALPGEISSNQTLTQGNRIYSQDGTVYLEQESTGALNLVNSQTGALIYQTPYNSSVTDQPFRTTMQTDCNLVTYSASNQVSFATQTTVILDNYAVTPPCRLAISGTGGGFIALIDSFASGDQSDTVLFTRPLVGDGTMTEGQILPQNVRLYSADGQVFVNVQADGNAVLYNTTLKSEFGASAYTAVTDTGTYGMSEYAPFELTMQSDCNLVLYKNANTTGFIPDNIIYQSNTAGMGTGCQFIISSQQGGLGFILNDANQVLFELPSVPISPVSTAPPASTLPPATSYMPTSPGTLFANQNLLADQRLFSPDGTVFLVPQADGNLVLYNYTKVQQNGGTSGASAIAYSGTSGPQPISLNMQPDCNLVMYSNGSPLFYTATYGKGSTCKMIVSSANGGYFAVLDPNNNVVYSNPPQPVAPPPTTPPPTTSQFGSGMLASGQVLQELTYLYSADGGVYVVVQADGNLVLYNSTLVAQNVPAYQAAIYQTATYESPAQPPYFLAMQPDCNLVLYHDGTSSPNTAIFQSNTYNKGVAPCNMLVSSASGGFFAVKDSTGAVLYRS